MWLRQLWLGRLRSSRILTVRPLVCGIRAGVNVVAVLPVRLSWLPLRSNAVRLTGVEILVLVLLRQELLGSGRLVWRLKTIRRLKL